ncbi:brachyurin-like [Toxorhynchites rutilus septentrionalis]|uniref:brachyurin-like n=1 Tax=Toxorhynchites rutilus septentrionalis TaxID=329112 RepID=UPI002478DC3B|nr:brachyurin-like [Toxorhynchites rutilus septentrionalis]
MLNYWLSPTILVSALICATHSHPRNAGGVSRTREVPRFWVRLSPADHRVVVSSVGNSKIAGGAPAKDRQFPYQAALLINFADESTTLCGGSIVSTTFVLTAAHCLEGGIDATVIVGTNTVSIPSDDRAVEIDVTFHDMLVHPKYDPIDVLNDIAIVRLTKALTFSDTIQPVKLPSRQEALSDLVNVDTTVSGWGALGEDDYAEIEDNLKLDLHFLVKPVISYEKCNIAYEHMIRDFQLCVSGEDGRNACQGDSGGPLTANLNGMTTLIGIVSYGSSDGCEHGSPVVYTRVGYYLDWIAQHTDVKIVD